ncbi:hypothetical protein B0T20DRAFT_51236 [Sordaria brevicollis]|uniref:Uncharacterized protein n=1 Tax=Sordaria brevicollis TaxID=83679 RepID=A0AAE0U6I7_SORBR|nr:hypothetical protein B0T20DRAFT_51236 [Sordaria brevicollis]
MKFSLLAFAVASASMVSATNPKANEYKDGNCKTYNYGHARSGLGVVTMDDTSHSVYITNSGPSWYAYSDKVGKTDSGGACTGEKLGHLPNGCHNLDTKFKKRIRCVRRGQTGAQG